MPESRITITKHDRVMARIRLQHGPPVHTITLRREGGAWWAYSSDPAVLELFGTRSLVTPFAESAPAWRVKRHAEWCTPDSGVIVEGRP